MSGIAAELNLSVKTITIYRRRILQQQGFTTNVDITAYALQNGLIQ